MTENVREPSGGFKAADSFCRFIPTRWRQSTLALPLEAEGLLIRISAFNMEAGVPFPACRTTAARMLGIHRNKLDKVLAILVAHGEISDDEKGIYSARAIAEFKRSQRVKNRHQDTVEKPTTYPEATPEIPQSNPEATPLVKAEKTEEILRATLEEIREEKESKCPPSGAPKANVASRGSRLDREWSLPDDWRQWTRTTFPQTTAERVVAEADAFRDFWVAKPGKDGRKCDWEATWRNWCRKAFATGPLRPNAQPLPSWEAERQAKHARTRALIDDLRSGVIQ